MKISYVLPVYNSQKSICQCINSILNQNITPHEIIVIDDCSDDYTSDLLNYYKDRSIVRVLTNDKRKGAAYSRNFGNSLASGDVIAVCDADYYFPERSDAIEEFFNKYKEKSLFYSALELRGESSPFDLGRMDAIEWDGKSKCPISHPTVAYRKELADEVKYHEDSIETDLYEFFLLDAIKLGYLFGGCQNTLMTKIEGDSLRDKDKARELKLKKYTEYGIPVAL